MIDAYLSSASTSIARVKKNIQRLIFVQPSCLDYILATLVSGGHILLADTHGVGKTSLARALAASIDWSVKNKKTDDGQETIGKIVTVQSKEFARVQGTVDLLPQDILGFNRYNNMTQSFVFQPGPIFANILLCDEINLLTPKTQGAFLQAMEEKMVTIDGVTYQIPNPFLLMATMNIRGQHLFHLPLPQLDRFAIRLSLGYPNEKDEKSILKIHGNSTAWQNFHPVVELGEILAWQKLLIEIEIHERVIDYIVRFIRKTREKSQKVFHGLSARAGIKISQLARALAMVRGEKIVTIDHVKELLIPVFAHRLGEEENIESFAAVISEIEKTISV